MATATTIVLSGLQDATGLTENAADSREAAIRLSNLFWGIANGSIPASAMTLATSTTAPVRAKGTVTISSGSGATAATINGTAVSVTWGTSDTATATALAAAINANATTNKLVSAVGSAGTVIITAHVPGVQGGAITLTASGTGVSVTGSGKLAGTATGAGSDTAPTTYSLF